MEDHIRDFIKKAVLILIKNTTSNKKIAHLVDKHKIKIHFVPIKYRIFGGLLQSMNIQFGNFIEQLLHIIVENEEHLEINKEISGKRSIKLSITDRSEALVDEYITNCQNKSDFDTAILREEFNNLLDKCLEIEMQTEIKNINIKHDIDVLFKDKHTNNIYYLEVKYNDDHDTGKYIDINRKFIKTYIGISNIVGVYDKNVFKPILYYMTQKRMKGNIYLPEKDNIYRGAKLFDEFFTIKYAALDELMRTIGDDSEIVSLFDDLYNDIRYNRNFK